jgi:hypothetical protein
MFGNVLLGRDSKSPHPGPLQRRGRKTVIPPTAYAFGRMLRRLDAPNDLGRGLRFGF